jgi:hypothetical protein
MFCRIAYHFKKKNEFVLFTTIFYFNMFFFALLFPFCATIGWKYNIKAVIGIIVLILLSLSITYFYFLYNKTYIKLFYQYRTEFKGDSIAGWKLSVILFATFVLAGIILAILN